MEGTPTSLLQLPNARHRKRRRLVTRAKLRKRLAVLNRLMEENTDEFCKNTTLHGLKYLTSKELYPIERIFFGISFISVVLISGFFIQKVYAKWSTTPVIFGIDPKPSFITNEPFPAVTICNLNQAYKSRVANYSIYSTEYAMLQMLCKREVNVSIANTINDWSHLNEFIAQIAQPCRNMLLECRFGSKQYNCSEIFKRQVTDEGLCCVFNMVHPSFMYNSVTTNLSAQGKAIPVQWNVERGYPQVLPEEFYPRQTVGTGETLGLSLTLDVEADEYYCSSSSSIGFKISLHNPMELPSMREIGLLLATGRETKIRLRTEKSESEQHLRGIHRNYRQCLFPDEEKLTFYSHYSHRNCELECITKMLLASCGCITHYMPRLYGNETICSIYQADCVERIRLKSMTADGNSSDCYDSCLPSCYDITFMPDFFSTPLTHSGFQIANLVVKNLSSKYVEENIAVVHMYFKEHSYRSNKQTEFIGITDFLSSVGGLIGLFFGFSFISLAELIFYSLIRPCRTERYDKELEVNKFKQPQWNRMPQRMGNRFSNNSDSAAEYPVVKDPLDKNSYANQPYYPDEFYSSISKKVQQQTGSKIYPGNQWYTKRRIFQ